FLHDPIPIGSVYKVRKLSIGDKDQVVENQAQCGLTILRFELVKPQCQAFNEATAWAETLIVVVLEVSQKLKGRQNLRHRLQILPPHHLRKQLGGVLVM